MYKNVSSNFYSLISSTLFKSVRKNATKSAASLVSLTSKQEKIFNSILGVSLREPKDNDELLNELTSLYSSKGIRQPYVTKILGDTKSIQNQIILARWKAKMIREMGTDEFNKYMADILSVGTEFHETLETYFTDRNIDEIKPGEKVINYWKSVMSVLPNLGKIHMMEEKISHPVLCYSGQVDCVAAYKNVLCVIDWKTSRKPKPTLKDCYDDPFQIAAYAGAINARSLLKNKVNCGIIVKAYEDGSTADAHEIDKKLLDFYWFQFLQRLLKFHLDKLDLQIQN